MWSTGIDGIVWTLEIEVKFYLLCALFISLFRRYSLLVFLVPIALFMMAIILNHFIPELGRTNAHVYELAMVYMTVSQYIIFMFIGVMFHYMYCNKIDPHKAYACIGGLFVLFCFHWWVGPYSANLSVAWSYAFALLTFTFGYAFPNVLKRNRVFDFFANISYPLYVIHGVMGYVILRIMLDAGVKTWETLFTATCFCIFLAWFIHRVIELPSQALGKRAGVGLTTDKSFFKGFIRRFSVAS